MGGTSRLVLPGDFFGLYCWLGDGGDLVSWQASLDSHSKWYCRPLRGVYSSDGDEEGLRRGLTNQRVGRQTQRLLVRAVYRVVRRAKARLVGGAKARLVDGAKARLVGGAKACLVGGAKARLVGGDRMVSQDVRHV